MRITYLLFFSGLLLLSEMSFSQENQVKLEQLIQIADSLSKGRNYEEAVSWYVNAEKLANSLSDTLALNSIYYNLGIHYGKLGSHEKSIEYYKKSEILSTTTKNDSTLSLALHGLGLSNSHSLRFDTAIRYYEKALDIQQKKVKDPRTEAAILNGLTGVYIASKDMGSALEFSKKAFEKSKQTNDFDLQANISNSISVCLEYQGKYQEALRYKKESLKICKKNNLQTPLVLLANIGNNYALLKQTDSALVYYNKSHEMAITTNHSYGLARIRNRMGELYFDLEEYPTSLGYLTKSYDYFKENNDDEMQYLLSKNIFKLHDRLGDKENALAFLKEHQRLKDTIHKQTTEKKLEEFKIKYETQQKEEQIVSLDKENSLKTTIIEQKQRQKKILWVSFITIIILLSIGMWVWYTINKKRLLAKQENLRFKSIIETEQKERKRIAQDLHDSLGQSISALKMQASTMELAPNEQEKHKMLLKQVDTIYDELRDISHNIMPNTLITLGLVPAIRELIDDITAENAPEIQFEHLDDLKLLNEDQTITLFRIIQEAIVNVIKHAKATLVNISLENKNGITSLYIKDNGKGMEASTIKTSSGLGWRNIFSRVALLSGDIQVSSSPGQGTTIAIHLVNQ